MSRVRKTRAVDVWSLASVLYYVLDAGRHPYGDPIGRETRILDLRPDLSRVALVMPEAHDLLTAMLDRDPARRPDAIQALAHPFFWPDDARLALVELVSERLQQEPDDGPVMTAVRGSAADVFDSRGWQARLPAAFVSGGTSHRLYDPMCLRDCLRLVRNRSAHFLEMPADVRGPMGGTSKAVLVPFLARRLPRLFLATYRLALAFYAAEPGFEPFGLQSWRSSVAGAEAATAVAGPARAAASRSVPAPPRPPGPPLPPADGAGLLASAEEWLAACRDASGRAAASVRTVNRDGAPCPVVCAHTLQDRTKYRGGANTENPKYKSGRCRDWDVSRAACPRGERCDFLHSPLEAVLPPKASLPGAKWTQPPPGFWLTARGRRADVTSSPLSPGGAPESPAGRPGRRSKRGARGQGKRKPTDGKTG